MRLAPGARHEGKIAFTLPAVSERTRFVFRVRLYADGAFVCGQELDLDVWPDRAEHPGELGKRLHLYDPAGATASVLDRAGVKYARLAQVSAPPEAPEATVVLIGEEALDKAGAEACAQLAAYVQHGGRVIVLGQTIMPANLPVASKLDPSQWASLCFNRMATHPIMRGISDWDLSFWAEDRVVARGAYSKPEGGPAVTLVDSGFRTQGLDFAHLMETFRGRGAYLLCQLPLIAKYDREPMTRELLARILRYAAGDMPCVAPFNPLQTVVREDGAVWKALNGLGVVCDPTPLESLKPVGPILIEADRLRAASETQQQAVGKLLRGGATVCVSGPTPDDAPWLSRLAGVPVIITVQPYSIWDGRGMRNGWSPFTAGLSLQDLYWKRYDGGSTSLWQFEVPDYAIEPFQDFAVRAEGATELVFPGALLELRVGKGTLLADSRRWMTDHADLAVHAARNLSALMLGMGAEIKPAVHIRQLPKELDYRPLDLSQFANRSLRDDQAEDGEGGWSDQGSGADLRSFKTGRNNFQGIPFLVGEHPRSCLVLRNPRRAHPEKYPTEITIPIGYAVEGFYFLHGSAYTGNGQLATLQAIYEDGTIYDLKVIGGVNIADWASGPCTLAHEKDTASSVAWTGSTAMFPIVAVHKMLWVNPTPEVPVRAIRYFKTPEMGSVHILMGLTSVLKRDVKPLTPEQTAALAGLMQRAAAAMKQKDSVAAGQALRQALDLDPKKWDAYQLLADALEQAGDEEQLLEHYHRWVRNGAVVPLPYNRIAELLEKKKDRRGALDFYTRSLSVEWNQPPVIEAKRRLESELAK